MTEINDEGLTLTETVPLDASDEEREAAQQRVGELVADLQQAGYTVVVGIETTSGGDVYVLEVEP
jgi:hypothetical protein